MVSQNTGLGTLAKSLSSLYWCEFLMVLQFSTFKIASEIIRSCTGISTALLEISLLCNSPLIPWWVFGNRSAYQITNHLQLHFPGLTQFAMWCQVNCLVSTVSPTLSYNSEISQIHFDMSVIAWQDQLSIILHVFPKIEISSTHTPNFARQLAEFILQHLIPH